MKRICSLLLTLALVLSLCACGQKAETTPTWQEQYDLGVRYLSEGNYQEAIIAFTAAIEIDPKRAEAYVGRGDAYTGTADLSAAEELTAESREACESALADYLEAIGLDKLLAAVYGKAADVYLALGDTEAAAAILEQGYEATGDGDLSARLKAMDSYGNRWDSAFYSWDRAEQYLNGQLFFTYQATAYNDQGLPTAATDKIIYYPEAEVIRDWEMKWNEQGQLIWQKGTVHEEPEDYSWEDWFTYDAQGRLLPQEGQTLEYDEAGRVSGETYQTEDFSRVSQYTYDALGRVASEDAHVIDAGKPGDFRTVYIYDD